jgi:hypothetical protein
MGLRVLDPQAAAPQITRSGPGGRYVYKPIAGFHCRFIPATTSLSAVREMVGWRR